MVVSRQQKKTYFSRECCGPTEKEYISTFQSGPLVVITTVSPRAYRYPDMEFHFRTVVIIHVNTELLRIF